MIKIKEYFHSVGDSFSQFVNAVFLFSLDANQSISGRSYENRHKKTWNTAMKVIDTVYAVFGVSDHCRGAYEKDLSRAAKYLQNHKNIK